jgi:hypothetical protein
MACIFLKLFWGDKIKLPVACLLAELPHRTGETRSQAEKGEEE